MTTATKYIARQTAQRLILVACGDLDKLVSAAKENGGDTVTMTTHEAANMADVLRKARESLIGV